MNVQVADPVVDCPECGVRTSQSQMTGKSALIVDDSKSARFALRRYLEGHAYQVDAVESADEAMRFLDTSKPNVIFLDHVMPGVDGFTVLETLRGREETAAIPVVMCSSNEGDAFNQRAMTSGAQGVLHKPPNPDVLRGLLRDLESGRLAAINGVAPKPVPTISPVPPPAPPTVQSPTPTTIAAASPAQPASLAMTAGTPMSPSASGSPELESRMKKVSQGFFVQFAEIKATLAHLSSQQAKLAEQPASLRNELRNRLEENGEALSLISQRIENLEREVFSQLTEIRNQVERSLLEQSEQVTRTSQEIRQIAADEARTVAEKTVMTAAMRISDKLADAILGAVSRDRGGF